MHSKKLMKTKQENIIWDKSYSFALRIVKLARHLISEKQEYILSKQILKSGTSIGANIEEAIGGQSKKDFLAKVSIAYKEARETNYWLMLLKDSEILEKELAKSLQNDCEEIIRILAKIKLTTNQSL